MREILFRAKRIDNGEWINGYYVYDYAHNAHFIFKNQLVCPNCINDRRIDYSMYDYEIDPETLCKYTGLNDKNGNQIWENDIIRVENSEDEGTGKVEFYGGMWYVDEGVNNSLYDIMMYDDEAEVYTVGNIFDTPELLKGE